MQSLSKEGVTGDCSVSQPFCSIFKNDNSFIFSNRRKVTISANVETVLTLYKSLSLVKLADVPPIHTTGIGCHWGVGFSSGPGPGIPGRELVDFLP